MFICSFVTTIMVSFAFFFNFVAKQKARTARPGQKFSEVNLFLIEKTWLRWIDRKQLISNKETSRWDVLIERTYDRL